MLPPFVLSAAVLAMFGNELPAAEGPVGAVQDALRTQQFFFGERSGELDEPTCAALRRFQIRHGLPATGELDNATIIALQNPPSGAANTPGFPQMPLHPPPAPSPLPATSAREKTFLDRLAARAAQIPPPAQLSPTPQMAEPTAPEEGALDMATSQPTPDTRVTQVMPPPAVLLALPRAAAAAARRIAAVSPANIARRKVNEGNGTAEVRTSSTPSANLSAASLEAKSSAPRSQDEKPRWMPTRGINEASAVGGSEPPDSRIVRTITTTTRTLGRTTITERQTTTSATTPIPIALRAEPVEPRYREGFFKRIFRDD